MVRAMNSASAQFTKYLYSSLLCFTYLFTFFNFAGARPTGSKLPCGDGCKHIRLALGTDNYLIPQWTFLPVPDASEKILLIEVDDPLVPPDDLETSLKHQILGLNKENHLASRNEAQDKLEHKILVLGTDNYLISMQGTAHRRGESEQVLFLNTENQLASFRYNVHDNVRKAPSLSTQSKTLPTLHLTRRNSVEQELYLGSENYPARPRNGVGDVAEELVLLITKNMQRVSHQDEAVQTRILDTSSHLVLQMNRAHGEADQFNINNQATTLQSINRRDELEGSAAVVMVVETSTEQGIHRSILLMKFSNIIKRQYFKVVSIESPKPEPTIIVVQSMAGPPLPLIIPPGGDFTMGDSKNDSTAHNLTDIPPFSEQRTKIQNFTRLSTLIMPRPTVLAKETPPPQETLYGDSMTAFGGTSNRDFGYTPDIGCFYCVLRAAIGLSTLLAITSLLLLCCLSRKGQYIWINTINISGVQSPVNRESYRSRHIHRDESSGGVEERSNEISFGQGAENVNDSGVPSERVAEVRDRLRVDDTGCADRMGFASRQEAQSPNRLALPGEWVTPGNDLGRVSEPMIASRKDTSGNKLSPFQNWFNYNPDHASVMKKPGVFQRWFGWRAEKHVNIDDAPFYGPRDDREIHSSRTRNGEGQPDPSIILAEVTERLIGERIRQLSTILSINEQEEALAAISDPTEGETSSMSSIRAVATGSSMGTQRRDNTVRRSRRGASRAFDDMDGVVASLPISNNNGTNTHGGIRRDVVVGEGEREISAGQAMASSRKGFGRASVRQYLFPTVEYGNTLAEGAPYPEDTNSADSRTTVGEERREKQTGSAWEDISHSNTNDMNTTVSADFTMSEATGAKPERQLKKDVQFKAGGSGEGGDIGSSIGDDSTLTVDFGENSELVNSRLPMEEGPGPMLREVVVTSGFAMGSDLVLNQAVRTGFNTVMEEVVSGECGVNAFGPRAKSPRWDSQTSNGDSELSSGYFSGNSENTESEPGTGLSIHPADYIKKVERVESEMTMRSALNGQLETD